MMDKKNTFHTGFERTWSAFSCAREHQVRGILYSIAIAINSVLKFRAARFFFSKTTLSFCPEIAVIFQFYFRHFLRKAKNASRSSSYLVAKWGVIIPGVLAESVETGDENRTSVCVLGQKLNSGQN